MHPDGTRSDLGDRIWRSRTLQGADHKGRCLRATSRGSHHGGRLRATACHGEGRNRRVARGTAFSVALDVLRFASVLNAFFRSTANHATIEVSGCLDAIGPGSIAITLPLRRKLAPHYRVFTAIGADWPDPIVSVSPDLVVCHASHARLPVRQQPGRPHPRRTGLCQYEHRSAHSWVTSSRYSRRAAA